MGPSPILTGKRAGGSTPEFLSHGRGSVKNRPADESASSLPTIAPNISVAGRAGIRPTMLNAWTTPWKPRETSPSGFAVALGPSPFATSGGLIWGCTFAAGYSNLDAGTG